MQSKPHLREWFTFQFDKVFSSLLGLCLAVSVGTTLAMVVLLIYESYQFFHQVPLFDFLFGKDWQPLLDPKSFGVLPLVMGTFHIVVGSMLIAAPIAILIAVYLNEFTKSRWKSALKPVLEVLAGIPSVVYGYFAINFITPQLQKIFPNAEVFNSLSASIVVGIMILPMIVSLTDDAFRSIPGSVREGAYALGATPLEVSIYVLIPSVASRIIAAMVLAISRAVGETMAVTLAAGATPNLTWNPLESIQTMTSYIVQVSLGDTPAGGIEYMSCFAVAMLLFVLTFAFNSLGSYLMIKFGRKLS